MVNLFAWKNHNHDASDINSGTLAAARIPSLDAGIITTGTFAQARVPMLDAAPRGTVFYAEGANFSDTTFSTALGFGEISFTPQGGRLYEITWQPPNVYVNTSVTSFQATITYTTDNSRPLVGSTALRWEQIIIGTTGALQTPPAIRAKFSVGSTPSNPWRFLGVLTRAVGSGTLYARALSTDPTNHYFRIDDKGLSSAISGNSVVSNNGL